MKTLLFTLVPGVALLVSACAPEPIHHGYGYGGPGYSGGSTVYVEGQDRDHGDNRGYNDGGNYSDVNVNRTTENDRTVNRTNVNEANVNSHDSRTANTKGKHATVQTKKTAPKHDEKKNDQQ